MMGAKGTGFGRNVPIEKTTVDRKRLLDPDPRDISEQLMARDTFKPAGIINALAAAWLQFENHNWFFHGNGLPDDVIEMPLRDGDDWPERPMRIRDDAADARRRSRTGATAPRSSPTSRRTGGTPRRSTAAARTSRAEIRTFVDGKIKVDDDGRLPPAEPTSPAST